MSNWKTTVLGLGFAVLNGVQGIYANGGHITWATAGASAFAALFGFAAKDYNVTGGSVQQ
jgi:hypothetical protein